MNTYTNSMRPTKRVRRITRDNLFHNTAITITVLALVAVAAAILYRANQPVVAVENNPPVSYSNALEMQYAQPWLEAQNRPVVPYSNALELQYAQPWQHPIVVTGNAQEQSPLNCDSSLEMFYACKYGFGRP